MKLSPIPQSSARPHVKPINPKIEEKDLFERLLKQLQTERLSPPVVKLITDPQRPSAVSLIFLCRRQSHVVKYLSEMVTRWLIPSKRLPLARLYMTPCLLNEREEVYMMGEIELSLSNPDERSFAASHFDLLKAELELGLSSPYHANRLMEMKALSTDEKRLLVQDRIVQMIHRFPNRFETDIFSILHHFFLSLSGEYLRSRETKQFSANLAFFYLMKKELFAKGDQEEARRHVCIKVVRRSLHLPFGTRSALGILVGVNFLRENEKFGKEHLLKAVQTVNASLSLVEESELLYIDPDHNLQLLYLEFEKEGGERFSNQDISRLKERLSHQVQVRIEQLQHPLFMPRNEEEVLRHIVTLGRELKFSRDVPQIVIHFEKQTGHSLHFVAIVARVAHPDVKESSEIVDMLTPTFRLDRNKKLGHLRNKYPKEALVFKVELPVNEFLREDHSIDLYRARHDVLKRLEEAFGPLRDYNGGIISKQNEALDALLKSLGAEGPRQQFLLENFFHSITPVERRSLVKVDVLRQFFLVFLKVFENLSFYQNQLEVEERDEALCIVVELKSKSDKEIVQARVRGLQLSPHDLLSFVHERDERVILGYMFLNKDRAKRNQLLCRIKERIEF